MFAPIELNGKKKVFEETFESPAHLRTEEQALQVLDDIRKAHPSSDGWVEFAGYVSKNSFNGMWQAIRLHAKYA